MKYYNFLLYCHTEFSSMQDDRFHHKGYRGQTIAEDHALPYPSQLESYLFLLIHVSMRIRTFQSKSVLRQSAFFAFVFHLTVSVTV